MDKTQTKYRIESRPITHINYQRLPPTYCIFSGHQPKQPDDTHIEKLHVDWSPAGVLQKDDMCSLPYGLEMMDIFIDKNYCTRPRYTLKLSLIYFNQ